MSCCWKWMILITAVTRAATAQVEVLGPGSDLVGLLPLPSDPSPDFTGPIDNVTVAVGREAILSCSVTDLGHYKIAWARAEDQTILSLQSRVITHNPRISVSHDDLRTWQLRIRQLKESDRGCYMCQINTNSMKKKIGCIDVQVPPDIVDTDTSGDVTVSEGENSTLVCRATGHPAPRILWRREDGNNLVLRTNNEIQKVDTYSGSTLTLVQLGRRQMGAYLCIASNDVPPAVSKRITVNVNFAPLVKVPSRRLGAPRRSDVELTCYIEAFPYVHTRWLRNGNEIHHDGKKFIFRETRSGYNINTHLVINNITRWDYDVYTCSTSNEMGQAEGSIKLHETKPPVVIVTQTTVTSTETEPSLREIATTYQPSVSTETQTIIINVLFAEVSDNSLPSVAPAPLETYVGLATSFHSSKFSLVMGLLVVVALVKTR